MKEAPSRNKAYTVSVTTCGDSPVTASRMRRWKWAEEDVFMAWRMSADQRAITTKNIQALGIGKLAALEYLDTTSTALPFFLTTLAGLLSTTTCIQGISALRSRRTALATRSR
jgi:hypothetical protein